MKKLIMLISMLALFGCAHVRVWQEKNSDHVTTEADLKPILVQCEQQYEVAYYHSRARIWQNIANGTLLIPFLGLGMQITADSLAQKYIDNLATCMWQQGFYCNEKKGASNKFRWSKLSDLDISAEEWDKQWKEKHPEK